MRVLLTLERFDKDYRLLERRNQWSRSFVKSIIDLLYIQMSQRSRTATYGPVYDTDMVPAYLDSEARDSSWYRTPAMRVANAGFLQLVAMDMADWPLTRQMVLGADLGIQVGTGTDPVTPLDKRLANRIGCGRRAPDGSNVLMDSNTLDDDQDGTIQQQYWRAQQYIPFSNFKLSSVKIKVWKSGNPTSDLTFIVRPHYRQLAYNTSPYPLDLGTVSVPASSISGSSPGTWVEFTLPTPVQLQAGHRYWMVFKTTGGDGSNQFRWRYDQSGSPFGRSMSDYPVSAVYSPVQTASSNDSGGSWTDYAGGCHMIEIYGQSYGDLEYGSCDVYGLSISGPNGEFTVRRFFENKCGSPITVNEVGLVAVGICHSTTSTTQNAHLIPTLVARDLISGGQVVANNEILKVTYTPQITV